MSVKALMVPEHGDLHYRLAFVQLLIDRGESEAAITSAKCELADCLLAEMEGFFRRARRPIPMIVRARVWARDDFKCRECQSGENLTIDHIIPHSKGGSDDEVNLRTLCSTCNSKKGVRIE